MTAIHLTDFAAAHGYSFDELTEATSVLKDDDGYWTERGPKALMQAIRQQHAAITPDLPGCGSRAIRI